MSIEEGGGGAETVEQKLDKLSASVDQRFDAVDQRFEAVDQRFNAVDRQFDDVRAALAEQRQYTEFAFDRLASDMSDGFKGVEGRFNRLERKLDQFIDTQSKANELVERRLQMLEAGPTN
jgi:ABC-type transporter Mla subunit MlaD